jgi:oligopeptide transport system permease protein
MNEHPNPPAKDTPDRESFVFVGENRIPDAEFNAKPVGFFRDALSRLCRNVPSVIAFFVIVLIVFLALFAPGFNAYGFNEQNADRINMPPRVQGLEKLGICDGSRVLTNRRTADLGDVEKYPKGSVIKYSNVRTIRGVEVADVTVNYYVLLGASDEYYWMGTDYLGRDLFTRLFVGARVSLLIAVLSVLINAVIGVVYGAAAGYYGGKVDMVLMRITEVLGSIPNIAVVTMFILFFGTGILSVILALVMQGWIYAARLTRAQFYRLKVREYVLAARTLGSKDRTLIFRHILPNAIGPLITTAMIAIPGAIFAESFLAYIGLGIKAPMASIGVLLAEAQKSLMQLPYQTFFPAALLSLLMIAFNMFADGLRDAFDPSQRGKD